MPANRKDPNAVAWKNRRLKILGKVCPQYDCYMTEGTRRRGSRIANAGGSLARFLEIRM